MPNERQTYKILTNVATMVCGCEGDTVCVVCEARAVLGEIDGIGRPLTWKEASRKYAYAYGLGEDYVKDMEIVIERLSRI